MEREGRITEGRRELSPDRVCNRPEVSENAGVLALEDLESSVSVDTCRGDYSCVCALTSAAAG